MARAKDLGIRVMDGTAVPVTGGKRVNRVKVCSQQARWPFFWKTSPCDASGHFRRMVPVVHCVHFAAKTDVTRRCDVPLLNKSPWRADGHVVTACRAAVLLCAG